MELVDHQIKRGELKNFGRNLEEIFLSKKNNWRPHYWYACPETDPQYGFVSSWGIYTLGILPGHEGEAVPIFTGLPYRTAERIAARHNAFIKAANQRKRKRSTVLF